MSERGLCSRSLADEWIANGWVKVDGTVVAVLGTRVDAQARIEIDAAATRGATDAVTILAHKPEGAVSLLRSLTPERRWAADPSEIPWQRGHLQGLAVVAALDVDAAGLVIVTQDRFVARRLGAKDANFEREYLVRLEAGLAPAALERLRHGLSLDGAALKPAHVSWQNERTLRIVLREERGRQVRRMCEAVGAKVAGIKRIRIGSVPLAKLPVGEWRYLARGERI